MAKKRHKDDVRIIPRLAKEKLFPQVTSYYEGKAGGDFCMQDRRRRKKEGEIYLRMKVVYMQKKEGEQEK